MERRSSADCSTEFVKNKVKHDVLTELDALDKSQDDRDFLVDLTQINTKPMLESKKLIFWPVNKQKKSDRFSKSSCKVFPKKNDTS